MADNKPEADNRPDMKTLFKATTLGKHRDVKDVGEYRTALAKDLGLALNDSRLEKCVPLQDFLVDLCMNIPWYSTELTTKMKKRNKYVFFNVILIMTVPLAVYWLPLLPQGSGTIVTSSSVAIVVAQLTALLTGLFGLNRVFLEWQKANNRYAQLWEAAANLLTEYFTLQTKWHGKLQDAKPEILQDFELDMKNATTNARTIVRKEQDDFYKTLSAATPVDALNILKEVQGVLTPIVSGLKPADAAKQLEAAEKEQKDAYKTLVDQRKAVAKLEAELGAIEGQIAKREAERNNTPAPSDDEKKNIDKALDALRTIRASKEAELVVAKGGLAALTGI